MSFKPCITTRHVLFSSLYNTGTQAQKDEVTCPTLNNLYIDTFKKTGECMVHAACPMPFPSLVSMGRLGKGRRCSPLPSAGCMRRSGKSAGGTGFL